MAKNIPTFSCNQGRHLQSARADKTHEGDWIASSKAPEVHDPSNSCASCSPHVCTHVGVLCVRVCMCVCDRVSEDRRRGEETQEASSVQLQSQEGRRSALTFLSPTPPRVIFSSFCGCSSTFFSSLPAVVKVKQLSSFCKVARNRIPPRRRGGRAPGCETKK